MKFLNLKFRFLSLLLFMLISAFSFSQQGKLILNQDTHITTLLDLKKEINKNDTDSKQYKIQVYSGNRSGAYAAQETFKTTFDSWQPSMQYETPNFKVWVGNFRTRLEADRALRDIKLSFPNAFILKPKRSRN